MARRDRVAAVAVGALGGFAVGLTSVGSGVFFALTMLIVFPLRSQKVVGTDVFHAAALLWVAGAGHIVAGNVDFHAVAWLLLGSVPGVFVGSRLTARLSDRTLRLVLAALLAVSGARLLAGPAAGAAVAGVVLAILAAVAVAAVRGRGREALPPASGLTR